MRSPKGFTLAELVVVLSILAAVSTILLPLFTGTLQNANTVATQRSLLQIRDAVCRYWSDTKHMSLDGMTSIATEATRFKIDWLFTSPVTGSPDRDYSPYTKIGWCGPYIASSTGALIPPASPVLIDAWNHEIELQDVDPSADLRDVRIVSAGADGVIDIPASTATSALSPADVKDDIYVALSLR